MQRFFPILFLLGLHSSRGRWNVHIYSFYIVAFLRMEFSWLSFIIFHSLAHHGTPRRLSKRWNEEWNGVPVQTIDSILVAVEKLQNRCACGAIRFFKQNTKNGSVNGSWHGALTHRTTQTNKLYYCGFFRLIVFVYHYLPFIASLHWHWPWHGLLQWPFCFPFKRKCERISIERSQRALNFYWLIDSIRAVILWHFSPETRQCRRDKQRKCLESPQIKYGRKPGFYFCFVHSTALRDNNDGWQAVQEMSYLHRTIELKIKHTERYGYNPFVGCNANAIYAWILNWMEKRLDHTRREFIILSQMSSVISFAWNL